MYMLALHHACNFNGKYDFLKFSKFDVKNKRIWCQKCPLCVPLKAQIFVNARAENLR